MMSLNFSSLASDKHSCIKQITNTADDLSLLQTRHSKADGRKQHPSHPTKLTKLTSKLGSFRCSDCIILLLRSVFGNFEFSDALDVLVHIDNDFAICSSGDVAPSDPEVVSVPSAVLIVF